MTQETINQVLEFRDDRNWKQFHNPKDLALSISLEAAELLEVFQWSGADVSADKKLDKIKEELADVLIYSCIMANDLGLSIDEIVQAKIDVNKRKYPVNKAYGSAKKYTDFQVGAHNMIVYDGLKSDFLRSVENDTIAMEMQKGYMVKGKVIRPAMVQVVSNQQAYHFRKVSSI